MQKYQIVWIYCIDMLAIWFLIWICMWNELCGFITCQGIELQNCLNTIPWILDKLKCEIGWIVLWYEIMHNLNWIFGYCCSYVWNVGNWMNWLNSLHVKGWIAQLFWSCKKFNLLKPWQVIWHARMHEIMCDMHYNMHELNCWLTPSIISHLWFIVILFLNWGEYIC